MTDEPLDEPSTDDQQLGEHDAGTEGSNATEEVQQKAEQICLALGTHREELEQVKTILQSADGLASNTGDLLAEFKQTAETLVAERQQLESEKAALVAREHAVAQAEQQRDQNFADHRATIERELAGRRAHALSALEMELADTRAARLADVVAAETAERERIRAEIAKERTEWDDFRTKQQDRFRQQRDELELQKGAVSALQSELEGRRVALQDEQLDLEGREKSLLRQIQKRRDNLDEDIATLLAAERRSFELSQQTATEEAEKLRASIQSQSALLGAFEELQERLGGRDPGAVILELNTKADEITRLTEELATRPTEEVRTRISSIEAENRTLQNRIEELTHQLDSAKNLSSESGALKRANLELEQKNDFLERRAKAYEAEAIRLQSEMDRLHAAYEKPAEVEARYAEIELPRVKFEEISMETQGDVNEADWLESVAQRCDDYGLHFHPRILKAFHTSLKTAEMSPLTVLAGVSGTGKSELPRLYSHFGGLYFEPLSVQPNWDSQESMLGFFNSIDNRFDAQPILRFLAQSQKPWLRASDEHDGYPGLADDVCMVLLDEMNLAHPELYFAEFLSKLELRRGKKGSDVPTLPVKIGAGLEPYQLPLGRNVLWAGTMNQDETTKSLSDKVLDRANVILFPRPTDLKRRKMLTPLDARNRGENLPIKTWQGWLSQGTSFTAEEFQPFKAFLEEMNTSLAVAGRAIGHRVLQSVEFYMSNYPDVRAAGDDSAKRAKAMHTAFEDQLVQKVMPKLRGIDTRGEARTDCLDKIQIQLRNGIAGEEFKLDEDFDLAMRLGYGQFIWQSANYLKVEAFDESE